MEALLWPTNHNFANVIVSANLNGSPRPEDVRKQKRINSICNVCGRCLNKDGIPRVLILFVQAAGTFIRILRDLFHPDGTQLLQRLFGRIDVGLEDALDGLRAAQFARD